MPLMHVLSPFSLIRQKLQSSIVGLCLLAAFMVSVASTPPKSEEVSLQLLGYGFEGEYLVIEYAVPYPGMTKVRLFDSGLTLLWRNQYVDDVKGNHKITLKASKLSSGTTYLFEFDYKGKIVRQAVTAP
jgi:hypothetical protein